MLLLPFEFISLKKFNINLPLEDDRAQKVYQYITSKYGSHFFLNAQNLSFSREDLLTTHTVEYSELLFSEMAKDTIFECYELYQSSKHRYPFKRPEENLNSLASSLLVHAHGTYQASRIALDKSFCFYLGGGMHHAMSFKGRGFCLVNDLVLSCRKLQSNGFAKKFWIIDVDAHKGDGTIELTSKDEQIKTLCLHMKDSWPLGHDLDLMNAQEKYAVQIEADVNIPIDINEEDVYCKKLEMGLNNIYEKMPNPDLVFIVLGADPYVKDQLPSSENLKLDEGQLLKRDKIIFNFLKEKNIPQIYTMGGGYGPESWKIYKNFLDYYLSLSNLS